MKRTKVIILILLLLPLSALADSNVKTIIKDNGDIEKEKVDSKKLCSEIRETQQKLLVATRPEIKGVVTVKEAVALEVFRADSSFGYAVKCVLQFPSL
jgi:hypothetical protein